MSLLIASSSSQRRERIPLASLTFTRSSEGSRLISAPTDGSTAFLDWCANDVLRFEDRGDGAGPLALFERSSSNELWHTRDLLNAIWSPRTYTVTATAGPGPDGATLAHRIQGSAQAIDQIVTTFGGAQAVASGWLRQYPNITGKAQFLTYSSLVLEATSSLTQTWRRFSARAVGVGNDKVRLLDSADRSGSGGVTAYTADHLADLPQFELGRYPTSTIRSLGSAATVRAADTGVLASGSFPTSLLSEAWFFTQVSPVFESSSDLVSGDVRVLLSLGDDDNVIRIRHNGTDVRVEAVESGSVKASSGALTYSRHGLLGAVSWDPVSAIVTVGGVAGAAGTPWTWASADLRVGGVYGGADEADARLGSLVRV